jgi:hypothetical protein
MTRQVAANAGVTSSKNRRLQPQPWSSTKGGPSPPVSSYASSTPSPVVNLGTLHLCGPGTHARSNELYVVRLPQRR